MRRKLTILAITLTLVVLAGSSAVLAQVALGTSFTYQGQLKQNGSPVSGSCISNFKLFDASSAGTQKGPTLSPTLSVVNGLFTTQLDFGDQFTGDARWVEITIDCGGGAITLSPRQALVATPYALGLLPGAQIVGSIQNGSMLEVDNNIGSGTNNAIQGFANNAGSGVHGNNGGGGAGVFGDTGSASSAGVVGTNYSTGPGVQGNGSGGGYGVVGDTTSGYAGVNGNTAGPNNGVYGYANNSTGSGVYGRNDGSSVGVAGSSNSGYGVAGSSASGDGVSGVTTDGYAGVYGNTTGANNGVYAYANNSTGSGVYGRNDGSSTGVGGSSNSGYGLDGGTTSGYAGMYGHTSGANNGVYGHANNSTGSGIYGANDGGGPGVAGSSASGDGVQGKSTSNPIGFAFRADGHAQQTRSEGGWVKAMANVNPYIAGTNNEQIVHCFNSQASGATVATPPCGFTYTHPNPGEYVIDFGFNVYDRFVSVMPYNPGACVVPLLYNTTSVNQWDVEFVLCSDRTNADNAFYIIVY